MLSACGCCASVRLRQVRGLSGGRSVLRRACLRSAGRVYILAVERSVQRSGALRTQVLHRRALLGRQLSDEVLHVQRMLGRRTRHAMRMVVCKLLLLLLLLLKVLLLRGDRERLPHSERMRGSCCARNLLLVLLVLLHVLMLLQLPQ
jgi:hypothetical protein